MRSLLMIVLLVLVVPGCGRSDLPELGSVSGVVTLDGQPVPNAIVNFTPTGQGRPSSGETDADGYYSLLYTQDVDGAIVGTHTVTIEQIVTDEADDLADDGEAGQTANTTLPDSAGDGSMSEEVKSGSNTIDFKLTSS